MKKTNKTLIAVVATLGIATGFSTKVEAASYTVQPGDSLWAISQKYNTTVSNLKSINNLSSNSIYVNQVIETSETTTSTSGSSYTVQSGDSLWGIAHKHGISVSDLMKWNNKTSSIIHVGETLSISQTSNSTTSTESTSNMTTYKVSAGDSLYAIANRFNVSVSNLKSWNNLTTNTIYIGQTLKLTGSTSAPTPTPVKVEQPEENLAAKVIAEAKKHVGTPYKWAGVAPGGFDCSGFIYYVHKTAGMDINRTDTTGYYNQSSTISSPQPGDLVFFSGTYKAGISHMGIYIGDNKFIHASSSGVQITSLSNSYWSKHFTNYRRWN
ncbi:LysM peptidoglycan-binding domain-containing protein [Aquibacillus kalidii]|uniref:LysM peptidoglycan-binding domain-containing protein n=1 Tax=Aquibacillus kalidii TaxID=2762597 RepID=UPI0016479346|nr:LysM peptidoglycan-binding domain-containing protein [Aquibacillus kalidii]